MKTLKLTAAIAFLLMTISASAQTKQETIDWINSKSNHQFVTGDVFKSSQKMKINSDGSFVITNTDYDVPFNPMKPQVLCSSTLRGNFKNLSPTSVSVRKEKGLIFIDINCSNGSNCIKAYKSGDCGIEYGTDGIVFGAFDGSEDNIAARLKKAFIHLINLCGGREEAF
jgi:opacity protein-like surface antigen